MEHPEQPTDPQRGRAAFNMVALYLAGYTYDQIELFHPADMTEDRLHDLLIKKLKRLLREWAVKQHLKVETGSSTMTP
jgi:hypothetical protein